MHRLPRLTQIGKPLVGGRFIAHLSPNALLDIQPRLVARQVCHMQPGMRVEKRFNLRPPMPRRPIHIEPHRVPVQLTHHLSQTRHKPGLIAPRRAQDPPTLQHRSHPAKTVEPGVMLTRGRNAQPLPSPCPPPAQTGMQGEARLILKDHRVTPPQRLEFFLTVAESVSRPLPAPARTRTRHASGGTLTGGASAALAARARRSQSGA